MKKLFLIVFIIGLTSNIINAQKTYSKQEMLDDIDSLYVMISEIHPDMFENISQEDYEIKIKEAKSLIQDNMTRLEFYRIAAPLFSCLNEGHTFLNFEWTDIQKFNGKHFPYSVRLNDEKPSLMIGKSFKDKDSEIPSGAQIISINHKPAVEIINSLLRLVSGETDFYKVSYINNMSFPFMAAQFIGDSIFDVEYIHNDLHFSKTVFGVTYKQIFNASKNVEDKHSDYSLEVNYENGIAILHFNRFIDIERFSLFLDSAFTVIHKYDMTDLIIDLRRNMGGNSILGDELFQYISTVPFNQFGKTIIRTSHRQKQFHYEYAGIESNYENGYKIFDDISLTELRENSLRFNGNVYVLTSHTTFSSAASFSWAFRYFEMGTVIGEETGGLAVSFGDMIIQKLPNTELMMGVSHKKYYYHGATDENKHGVIPDYQVSQEKAMDFAIDLILKSR
jgi:hypothetical protein